MFNVHVWWESDVCPVGAADSTLASAQTTATAKMRGNGKRTPNKAPYYQLGPDTVIAGGRIPGLICDGRLLALNSYENRVYQVGMEEGGATDRQVLPARALER